MKKTSLIFALILAFAFYLFGCGCNKEKNINKEEALEVLKESVVRDNVEIVTTTETTVNNIKTVSTQSDIYYNDKYYHLSENNNISTKTWYGEVNNVLYAFYYTKNANNEETKTSSRIESTQLESVKQQPNSIYNTITDTNGNLLQGMEISASKLGRTYTIQITNSNEDEANTYTYTIEDAKIKKIVQTSNIGSDSIIITYDYNYDVEDIELPTLSEYPLNVNG